MIFICAKMLNKPNYKNNNNANKKLVYLRIFLSTLLITALVSSRVFIDAGAASDVPLSISISLVEGDTFGPGDSFHSIVEIRNREAQGRIDVVVTYQILDPDGNFVISSRETVAVETVSSFVKNFDLPTGLDEGKYLLMANVSTLDSSKWSVVSRSFNIVVVSGEEQTFIQYLVIAAFVFTGILWFYEHRRISKLKISGRDLNKFIEEQKRK